jgi:hypothetical protein
MGECAIMCVVHRNAVARTTLRLSAAYVNCAHLGPHLNWSRDYSQTRGIYNDN